MHKKVHSFTYYLDPGQNAAEILTEYSESIVDIIERSIFGAYRVQDEKSYRKGVLRFYYKNIYKEDGHLLCEHEYDLFTMMPVWNKTEKYLYVSSDSLPALGFDYDEEGEVSSIWGDWVCNTDQGQTGFIKIADISRYFPNLFIDYPYFKNADFFPV